MSDTSPLPPLIGRQHKKYLAKVFGSPDEKVASIPGKFARQRCEARIELEEDIEAVVREELFRDLGSPTGELADLEDAETRENAVMKIHHAIGWRDAEYRELLESGDADDADHNAFLHPFDEDDLRDIDRVDAFAHADIATGLTPMDVSRLPDDRLRFIALICGAEKTENLPDIPADNHQKAKDLLNYHHDKMEAWLGHIATIHGSPDASVATIPKSSQAAAARHWHKAQSLFAARIKAELQFRRIDIAEAAADFDFG